MKRLIATLVSLAVSGAAFAASPALFTHIGANTNSRLNPLEKERSVGRSYPVTLNTQAIADAVNAGGMYIDLPDGKRLYARMDHREVLRGGNITWVGKVSLPGGERSVVITTGQDATFGSLVSDDGSTLELISDKTSAKLVVRDPKLVAQGAPDYVAGPNFVPTQTDTVRTQHALAQAASGTQAMVNVLAGYTSGLVSRYGSDAAAVTRLNYLVSVTNQAYQDSQVNGRLRLVATKLVDYSDTNSNSQVLSDLENKSGSSPLQVLRDARRDTGADLVTLVRPFLTPEDGNCGLATVNGSNLAPYTTASAPGGYSAVSDGTDDNSGYYCEYTTFAHELGHNMGLVHDIDDSSTPGAFPYAYGWRQTLPKGSFHTIMAYSTADQVLVPYFADPNITLCNGNPCGDATQANQTLALNQTMPVVAAFNAPGDPLIDINGDRSADLVFQSDGGYAAVAANDGYPVLGYPPQTAKTGYHIAATGDFEGHHVTDFVWSNGVNDLSFWMNQGDGTFVVKQGPGYPADGWMLVGTTSDMDGDGKSDLLWINTTTWELRYWLMDGATKTGEKTFPIPQGEYVAAVGDFNGDGYTDLVLTSSKHNVDIWFSDGKGGFTVQSAPSYGPYMTIVGAGDINGDGYADLVFTQSSTHDLKYWLMNGSKRLANIDIPGMPAGYTVAAVDRFSGATASILWTSAARDLYIWTNDGSGNFTSKQLTLAFPASAHSYYKTYPKGWSVVSGEPTPLQDGSTGE